MGRETSGTGAGREQLGTAWHCVLRADGTVLLAYPASFAPTASGLAESPGFRIAAQTGKIAFGDIRFDGTVPNVMTFQPFDAPDGPRVLAVPVPVADVAVLASGALTLPGGSSYLVDGQDQALVAPGLAAAGAPLGDPALLDALRTSGNGVIGGRYYSAHPVSGTDWRVVMTTSRTALLAPVQTTGRVAWQIFGAFVLAIIVILLIGAAALISSTRLARARLHDTLTGLPNRALFTERADAAIAEFRRKRQNRSDGAPAALFLDLDGFKPVNDTYGHAAGDLLLQQVATRLVDATRPGDLVSRIGGDEFQVLCRGLRTEDDAFAVADRIQSYLAEPFDLDGRSVRIGVSIGVATLDDDTQHLAALLHQADLALYRAKQNGRGRVERFTPDLAGSAAAI